MVVYNRRLRNRNGTLCVQMHVWVMEIGWQNAWTLKMVCGFDEKVRTLKWVMEMVDKKLGH
jgi:hypothetical protein